MCGSYIIHSLRTGYRTGRSDKEVSFLPEASLHTGEMTCLLGPNGAGKSTLLRTMAGFQPPLEGGISLFGKPLTDYKTSELARKVSIVLTDNSHIHNLSVFDVVAMGRNPYTGFWGRLSSHDKDVIHQCMEWVNIEYLASQRIDAISDGERQKVMLAKAIAQETPVILLDEPTNFLYYPDKVHIMQLLKKLAHEMDKTVLFSTHAMELALQMADQIWFLDKGRMITGTPESLCENRINELSYEKVIDCIDAINSVHQCNGADDQ